MGSVDSTGPYPDDRLIVRANFETGAWVPEMYTKHMGGFRDAYWASIDKLMRSAIAAVSAGDDDPDDERNDLDASRVIPPLFLFRHYVEVTLKWILRRVGVSDSELRGIGHDLEGLWSRTREFIDGHLGEEYHTRTVAMSNLIGELHELDPSGTGLRYPATLGGNLDWPEEFVDLNDTFRVMNDMRLYLCQVLDEIRSISPSE